MLFEGICNNVMSASCVGRWAQTVSREMWLGRWLLLQSIAAPFAGTVCNAQWENASCILHCVSAYGYRERPGSPAVRQHEILVPASAVESFHGIGSNLNVGLLFAAAIRTLLAAKLSALLMTSCAPVSLSPSEPTTDQLLSSADQQLYPLSAQATHPQLPPPHLRRMHYCGHRCRQVQP